MNQINAKCGTCSLKENAAYLESKRGRKRVRKNIETVNKYERLNNIGGAEHGKRSADFL